MKNMPKMDAPQNKKQGAKTGNLMDNQEQTLRGEQVLYQQKEPKVPSTVCIPYELKQRAMALAAREGTTLTFMITLGLKKQVEQDSIWL